MAFKRLGDTSARRSRIPTVPIVPVADDTTVGHRGQREAELPQIYPAGTEATREALADATGCGTETARESGGAGRGNRTPTGLRPPDFESVQARGRSVPSSSSIVTERRLGAASRDL